MLKTSHVLLSLIYSVSLILTFCVLFVLIIMLIGNYTMLGTKYYQLNNKLDQMIIRNVTLIENKITDSSDLKSKAKKNMSEKVYLYGHPWLMIILMIMTCITATSYIIKGIIYILNQKHENILKKKIAKCLGNDI